MRPRRVTPAVSRRARVLMHEQGLTGEAVARQMGITGQAVSFKLTGHTAWSAHDLVVISRLLGTSADYLLGESEDRTPPARPLWPEIDGPGTDLETP